jgi:arylsulfatase A-like enzyme
MRAPEQPSPAGKPLNILLVAVWCGILSAWFELGILGYREFIQKRLSFGMSQELTLWGDHRVIWMVPLVNSLIILVPAVIILLLARFRPGGRSQSAAIFAAVFLAVASILFNYTWLHQLVTLLLAAGVAVQAVRMVKAHPVGFLRLVRRTVPVMIVLVLLSGLAFGLRRSMAEKKALAALPAAPATPNVLLLILDTVRAFSLSAYGYERPTTPNLARRAESGVRFDRAFVTSSWTLPSHSGIFTGRYPRELRADLNTPLDNRFPTLAEAMRERGYATGGFVSNVGFTRAETGLGRGFIHYEDFVFSPGLLLQSSSIVRTLLSHGTVRKTLGFYDLLGRKNAARMNADLLRWIGSQQRPFFAFVNYNDAHRPYLPEEPYNRLYLKDPEAHARIIRTESKSGLPAGSDVVLRDGYDGALTYLDDQLGKLFAELEGRGILRNTIVIVTADHGEQFGEHGLFWHSNSLYRQLIQVPLIMFGSERIPAGLAPTTPVSTRDVPATVMALIGGGSHDFPGRSLTTLWQPGADSLPVVPVISELSGMVRMIRDFAPTAEGMGSIITADRHYIRYYLNRRTGKFAEEIFDLNGDPREERNLAADSANAEIPLLRAKFDSILPPVQRRRNQGRDTTQAQN